MHYLHHNEHYNMKFSTLEDVTDYMHIQIYSIQRKDLYKHPSGQTHPLFPFFIHNFLELFLQMTINISSAFVHVLDVAIWRINFLTNPLIFNGPFYNSTTILLVNCLEYELEHLILVVYVFTEEFVVDCFVLFINGFNTLMTCCNLTIY